MYIQVNREIEKNKQTREQENKDNLMAFLVNHKMEFMAFLWAVC